ncbi:MAG: amidohydrolase family protein [Aridibacter sp.]
MSPEAYFAVADESKKLGIVFAGHVPFLVSARDVSNAGQKSIEHLTGIVETCSSKENELRNKEWTPEVGEEMIATYDAKKCLELFKLFAKNRTYHVPTAVLHRGMLFYDDENFRGDPNFKYIPNDILKEWSESPQLENNRSFDERKKHFAWMLDVIGSMHRAGVPFLAGSDNNNPFVIPGFALHDELELFVRAGMTPFEALRTATSNPAKYLEIEKSYGTVEKGKIANLVLLDANPLEDIRNTRKIAAVILNGKYLPGEKLKAMLDDVEALVKRN